MKPIGHWLNRTDAALTRCMNEMLEESGLTRIAWQILNVIKDTPEISDAEVRSVLVTHADAPTLTAAVEAVLAGGWADRPAPGRLALTADGRRRLTEAAGRVAAFRDLSTAGISPEEYRTAVLVLERMTHNLETATGAGR
ncbi:MarR family winged helix-turn-helix transcriptional regulator [Streptomyces sp. MST-110588]|uniref:MarR family winged helix-turn-helix transcriptional regulator n=1 Tax=Streptomyces sp. MST-110588 TaxID=2833628 RepID=UPI001F5C1372|nr:MarR family winged helix-turn-helix transcriptional regulator [Streptomyces sp. MST-110588]UNO42926.1 winged helix-turn-helix transcriptional regulator [Streptomyces sp. MST-110588]